MIYSPEEFEALTDEIEAQGGAPLPDKCLPLDVRYTDPPYVRNRLEKKATCGCGFNAMFVVEYPKENGKSGFVRACAVCDNIGLWNRFIDAVAGATNDDQ